MSSHIRLQNSLHFHETSEVSDRAHVQEGTRVWHHSQIREGASIGINCILGKGVYIDSGVSIGNNVKIQNYVSVFQGVTLEDGVFIGPHVCFTNDLFPRAINSDGSPKAAGDWQVVSTKVKKGAAIGANTTIVCGNTIGSWAMVGAGSVVTKDVPDYGLVCGNPARLIGFVDPNGHKLFKLREESGRVFASTINSSKVYEIPRCIWEKTNDQYR